MSRSVPATRTGDIDPDGYAGMPIVISEDPEWLVLMAPETAPFGTRIQSVYRWIIFPVRLLGMGLRYSGDAILRGTMHWYTVSLILISAITLLIIYITR